MKFENYRPISALVSFSKLLQRLDQPTKIIDKIIYYQDIDQYSFGKNRSTDHAIIDFVDKITKAIEEGKYSVGIFLDMSRPFNTINHKILIKN